jgi:hypothetical protein
MDAGMGNPNSSTGHGITLSCLVSPDMKFIHNRSASLSMVVLVLVTTAFLESSISYTISYGRLNNLIPGLEQGLIQPLGIVVRVVLIVILLGFWILNRRQDLFKAIIVVNAVLTLGLFFNMFTLVDVLRGVVSEDVKTLLWDVVLLAVANILIFSIWYWIIDPPGVDGSVRDDEPWDFLFPQRAQPIPAYENWQPRYTDYIFLAFTASFAFSHTDTLPLTRRAKMLMLAQATLSIITLTAIASSALNIMAGGG